MADPIIQSNGRIGVLQGFMFENEALLDKIPGIEIERTKIGNKAGEIDDILGKGTATAIESLLIAAGIPEGSTFDEAAQTKLSEFLVKNGMDAQQVNTFVKDVSVVLNDKDLGPIYQRNAKADPEAIQKAMEAEVRPEVEKPAPRDTQKTVIPDGPVEYAGKDQPAPKESDEGIAFKDEQSDTVIMKPIVSPPDGRLGMSTIKPGAFVDETGKIVDPKDVEPVVTEEEYASIVDEYKIELVAAHKPTITSPKPAEEQPATLKGDDMMMAAHKTGNLDPLAITPEAVVSNKALPSFKGIGVPFLKADQHEGPAPLDVTKPGDISVTIADIQEMKAKGDQMTPDEAKLVAYVEKQHEARLAGNPEYQELLAQIKRYETGRSETIDAMYACRDRAKENSMALDARMNIFEHDHGDKKMEFVAEVDGKPRTFNLSLNQIKNGDIYYKDEDGDIERVRKLEVVDRQAVKQAGYAMFNMTLPYIEKEAYADYKKDLDQYNSDVEKLVSAKHTNGIATGNFPLHFRRIDHGEYFLDGEFYSELREINKIHIGQIRDRAEQMEENMNEGVYIVKKTDLDAFDPDKPMIAQNTTQDPAPPGVQI